MISISTLCPGDNTWFLSAPPKGGESRPNYWQFICKYKQNKKQTENKQINTGLQTTVYVSFTHFVNVKTHLLPLCLFASLGENISFRKLHNKLLYISAKLDIKLLYDHAKFGDKFVQRLDNKLFYMSVTIGDTLLDISAGLVDWVINQSLSRSK